MNFLVKKLPFLGSASLLSQCRERVAFSAKILKTTRAALRSEGGLYINGVGVAVFFAIKIHQQDTLREKLGRKGCYIEQNSLMELHCSPNAS